MECWIWAIAAFISGMVLMSWVDYWIDEIDKYEATRSGESSPPK